MKQKKCWDVIVVGGGHAGIEGALVSSFLGASFFGSALTGLAGAGGVAGLGGRPFCIFSRAFASFRARLFF